MTRPFENSAATILLRDRIRELQGRKTQSEIARAAGFQNANFISLLYAGSSKTPLARAPDLARAIAVDPALLMRLALEQSIGVASGAAVLPTFRTPVMANEVARLTGIRDASGHGDPSLTAKARTTIRRFFGEVTGASRNASDTPCGCAQ